MRTAAQIAAVLLAIKAMVLATALAMGWLPTKLPDLPTLLFLAALRAVQLTLAVAVLMAFDRYFNAIVDRVRRAWRT